jgi:hypothetical protein
VQDRPDYVDNPDQWPGHVWAMAQQLTDAGIPERTVFDLAQARYQYAAAVPIMVDWLEFFDAKVPPGPDRPATRIALIRNLITDYAKGNRRAFEILFRQFEIEPALSNTELKFAAWALRTTMEPSDFPRVADLLERHSSDLVKAYALINGGFDCREAIPIMVDWLERFDELVPSGDARRYFRLTLLRNLDTKHAKGNRAAVDVLFRQFDVDDPYSRQYQEVTGFALSRICDRSDFPRVAELLRSGRDFTTKSRLVRWLGRIKTDEAKQLAVSFLDDRRTRDCAMAALVQQRATGVREAVAKYLDDEDWRKQTQKMLDKLPDD